MDTWHEKTQDNGIEKNNDKTLYYINNELGSVVTLVDDKDKVKVEYSYDTFGVVAEKNHVNDQSIRSNIFHYTGYQYDYQTRLYFANARYYIEVLQMLWLMLRRNRVRPYQIKQKILLIR
jgi:hypothetical protein